MSGLELSQISFSYRSRPVLRDVSLRAEPRTFCVLLGANGAGKSTLLKCVNALLHPQSGSVTWNGRDTSRLSPQERAQLYGYVPQSTQVRAGLNVFETVLSGRLPHMQRRASAVDVDRVCALLSWLDLEEFSLRPLHQLSGGERQRVLIARALAQDPEVLLLDEPISNLDLRYQYEIMDLLRQIASDQGLTIVAVIHDLNMALDYADSAVLLRDGRVYGQGPPQVLLSTQAIFDAFHIKMDVLTLRGRPVLVPARPHTSSIHP